MYGRTPVLGISVVFFDKLSDSYICSGKQKLFTVYDTVHELRRDGKRSLIGAMDHKGKAWFGWVDQEFLIPPDDPRHPDIRNEEWKNAD